MDAERGDRGLVRVLDSSGPLSQDRPKAGSTVMVVPDSIAMFMPEGAPA
ncbi:hypothetical protein [Paracoccus sediminicola]|nr:hypothetical protein [Paracoccus sediminicola]WBU57698.1 hypothetical protein PAF18_04480 [Paracoccus sediminicola]